MRCKNINIIEKKTSSRNLYYNITLSVPLVKKIKHAQYRWWYPYSADNHNEETMGWFFYKIKSLTSNATFNEFMTFKRKNLMYAYIVNFISLTYNDKRCGTIRASIFPTVWMYGGDFEVKHTSMPCEVVRNILFARC